MRLAHLFSATALALVAASALAQSEAQPAGNGLNGLADTLNGLSDNGQTEAPPPVPAPVPAGPEARTETPAETAQEPAPPPPPPAPAQPPARPPIVMPPEPLTREQRAELQAAATRGRLLGVIEQAGRLATQDMLSRVPDPNAAGISGWIAEAEGNGAAVTFYADGEAGSGPVMVYRATINGGRIVARNTHVTGTRPPLNPLQARMAAARAATAGLEHRPCGGEVFNVFVVPPLTPDGTIDVYQISPQTRPGFYPLGGHFRTSVAPDGSVAGTRPAPIAVTHLMDPMPQDIHAFLSAWTGHPLIVVAGDPQRLFAVTPEGIAEVPREGPGR